MRPDTPPSRRRTKYFDADNSTNHNGTPRHRINIAEADQAESYRAIARVLGIDAADREAVERRVTELHDKTRSLGELFGFTFTCPRCGGHHFGSTLDPQTHEPILRHCHDEFGRGCRWSGSDAECGLAPKGD